MVRPRRTLAAIFIAVAACGGSAEDADTVAPATTTATPGATTADAPTSNTATSTTASTSVMTDATPLPDRSTITQEDTGKRFTTTLGNRVELQLSSDYLWTRPQVEGSVELVDINFITDPGFTAWELLIKEPGEITITAIGTPNCDGDYCDPQDRDFEVSIVVEAP